MSTAQFRELVLRLPAEDRASLARALIESLDPTEPELAVEATWLDEMETRAETLDRGEATADDWQASLARVRLQLRSHRR